MTPRLGRAGGLALLLVAPFLVVDGAAGQQRPTLRIEGPDGTGMEVSIGMHRGYASVPASALGPFGWVVVDRPDGWALEHAGGPTLRFTEGSPFFRWDDTLLQMAAEPYGLGAELHLPAQFVLDFLPVRLPDRFSLEQGGTLLRVLAGAEPDPPAREPEAYPSPTEAPARDAAELRDTRRVVVIDPGHGGRDPGSIGPGGTEEKDVALAIGRALRDELAQRPWLDVHMTRDDDILVPIWQRGEWANRTRGDRPGVFISIHANSLGTQRSARGFETYFLSDARTEHERRVAANENAPLSLDQGDVADADDPDLSFILKELRNLDQQHWSSLLAELVQGEVAPIHPGPNRGVKQAPLAVITNALMPAILVEAGFISNRDEERLLRRDDFQTDVARAIADAVDDFFRRYPPGQGPPPDPSPG